MKILLLEDDESTIDTIKFCVEAFVQESSLISTKRGQECLDLLTREKFDIVILDLGLPDMDGLDVLKQIRKFSSIPAIVVSARRSQAFIDLAKKLGANDYITKPFDYRNLLKHLNSVYKSPIEMDYKVNELWEKTPMS